MSREDIVAIAVRLFAVSLAIYTLRTAFAFVGFSAETDFAAKAVVASVAIVGPMIAASLLLWHFPLSVARRLLPVMKEPRSESCAGTDTLFSLGLVLMGLWLLVNAITDGIYWITVILAVRSKNMLISDMTAEQKAAMITTVAEAIVALFLILGSTGIRNAVYRFRNANIDTPSMRDE